MNAVPETSETSDVFRHPLEYIFADHDRQRIICAALERLANDLRANDLRAGDLRAADARENAAFILGHLENELPLHIADEERDLFPMLRKRCIDDDRVDELLALLQDEHEEDDAHCLALLAPLRAIAGGNEPVNVQEFVALAIDFARFQRRHLGWENGTVLPLAERRLTDDDQAELGRNMAARRGLNLPE